MLFNGCKIEDNLILTEQSVFDKSDLCGDESFNVTGRSIEEQPIEPVENIELLTKP